jgi:iron complex transport system ATP-binding protein
VNDVDLRIKGVSFAYRSIDVLNDVSFEASSGEIIGILGKNGCGKTTLMKCIEANLKPHTGCITLDEKDVSSIPRRDLAKDMAIVAQSANLFFPFTVFETVMMGRYPNSEWFQNPTDEDMKYVYSAMQATGITDFAERSVSELSGGEKQRVLISRALVQDPKVLLLDEPTLHLDINHQFGLMELVKKLVKEQRILIVIVTHDIALAARYCDRILLIEKGVIVGSGIASEVITVDNLKKVFDIQTEISYDERIKGLNVFVIGKS